MWRTTQFLLNPSPLLSPVYPCSFEKRGIFSFFRDHLRSRCCRILLFFSRLEPLLFDTNSDHSFTYQGCFWAISGDLASITGGQTRNRGTDPNQQPVLAASFGTSSSCSRRCPVIAPARPIRRTGIFSKRRPPLSRAALRLREIIHPAELDPMIERRRVKAASIDARTAGPEDHIRMGDDLLVSVGWADRHELASGSIDGHENGIMEQH